MAAQPSGIAAAHRLRQPRHNIAHTSIIGGTAAERGAFPWLAYLADFEGEFASTCTGTVVAPNLILTAGHCAVDTETGEIHEPGGFRVFTGGIDWNSTEGEVSGVSRVLIYPNYRISGSLEGWGDAALVELTNPTQSPAVKLAGSEIWEPGMGGIIAGWGKTYYEQERSTEYLRWARTVVQSKEWCQANAPGYHPYGQVCTIDPPSYATGTCHGDSGGPLFVPQPGTEEMVEIGITSSGYGSCLTSMPDVFTRSDLIAGWVSARVRELNPPPPQTPSATPASTPSPASSSAPELLPKMGIRQAKAFIRRGLTEDFRARFRRRSYYSTTCRHVTASRVHCGISWNHGGRDYYGAITVYYLRENGRILWNDRYRISWVNDRCYFYSGHRSRCWIHTRRR